MPAAAVIPALLVYIKVVAVKKLVVECRKRKVGHASVLPYLFLWLSSRTAGYIEKIRVFKAGYCSNISAWDNGIGR